MPQAPDPRRAGFVGVLPGRAGLVAEGLDPGILERWDRWFEMAARGGLPERLDPDRPSWRLAIRAGLFGPSALAGVMRLGRDATGRTYPVAVLLSGDPPPADDPWFDAAETLVTQASRGGLDLGRLGGALAALPSPLLPLPDVRTLPPDLAAILWRDDWEVHEHRFATPADLIAFPLCLAAEVERREEEAA